MQEVNCSLDAWLTKGDAVFSGTGCPEVAVVCGMNKSWVQANATAEELNDLCLSEEIYLAKHRGPLTSPEFPPVFVTYLSIFLVGVLGNSLTCAVILRYRVMQTPTNYYLLSLAISDLLVLLLGMPLELYEMWQNYPFLLGEGGCYFRTFLFETVCFASILNVTALSVERYVAVVHPLKVKHMTTRAHVKKVIFVLWVLSMLCAIPNTSVHGIDVLPPKFGRQFPRSAVCCMYTNLSESIYFWPFFLSLKVSVWVYVSMISTSTDFEQIVWESSKFSANALKRIEIFHQVRDI